MKAKRLLLSLLIIPLMGIGCAKSGDAIIVPEDYDTLFLSENYIHDIHDSEVSALINSEFSFSLYVYDPDCTACKTITPLLNSYIKKRRAYTYSFDVTNLTEYQSLVRQFPTYFYDGLITPTLYIFKSGKGIKIEQDRLKSQDSLTRILDQYITVSHIKAGGILESLNKFLNDNKNMLIILYDGRRSDKYKILKEHVMNHNPKSKGVFLINIQHIDEPLKLIIIQYLGANYENKCFMEVSSASEPFELNEQYTFMIDDYFTKY